MKQILILLSCLWLLACATAPMQEMSDARQAVQAAHDAGAGRHAPEVLKQAERQLNQAGEEIQTRQFRRARKDAVAAKSNAIQAQEMAHAIGAAKAVVEKAAGLGILSAEAELLLTQAKQAATTGDVQTAIRLANEAKHQAEQDLRKRQ